MSALLEAVGGRKTCPDCGESKPVAELGHGVTADDRDELARRRGGVSGCLPGSAAHMDHDHDTGLVRGLLCFRRNGGPGEFEDEPRRLREAADYLEGRLSHARLMELE